MEYINNFVLYNSIGFVMSLGMFSTLEYISDPDNFTINMKEHMNTIKFWSLDKAVSIYSLYKNVFPEQVEESKINGVEGLVYDIDGNLCNTDDDNLEAIYEKRIINEEEYFVKDHITEPVPNKLFMGCELLFDGEKIDINKEIEKFCVSGTKIDAVFLKAFIKQVFDKDLGVSYKLSCITTTCDMLSLNETQILYVRDNTYVIDSIGKPKVINSDENITREEILDNLNEEKTIDNLELRKRNITCEL